MGNKYHYDRHGYYRGMSSDTPPGEPIGVIILGCIFLYFVFFSGC